MVILRPSAHPMSSPSLANAADSSLSSDSTAVRWGGDRWLKATGGNPMSPVGTVELTVLTMAFCSGAGVHLSSEDEQTGVTDLTW